MTRIQKIILIIAFVVFVILIAFFLYAFFFQPLIAPPSRVGINENIGIGLPLAGTNLNRRLLPEGAGTLPREIVNANVNVSVAPPKPPEPISSVARGGRTEVFSLGDDRVTYPVLTPDGSHLVYYTKEQGQFFQITPDGSKSLLTEKKFHSVENITWSNDSDSAILEYPDGANTYYNFSTNKQVTLPKHWQEFDFSPSGSDIVAKSIGTNKESRYLIVSDPEGQRVKSLSALPLDHKNVIPDWSPNNIMVGMVVGDVDLDSQKILFIGLNNENFKSAIVEGWGFEGTWTPDGKSLLYSVHSAQTDDKPELWVVNATPQTVGVNRRNLKLQTWAHKCAFQNAEIVYCAVPSSLNVGAGFFPAKMDDSSDMLYRIDLQGGSKSLVAIPEGEPNMQNLSISKDGKFLFYVNSFDEKLYRLQLR